MFNEPLADQIDATIPPALLDAAAGPSRHLALVVGLSLLVERIYEVFGAYTTPQRCPGQLVSRVLQAWTTRAIEAARQIPDEIVTGKHGDVLTKLCALETADPVEILIALVRGRQALATLSLRVAVVPRWSIPVRFGQIWTVSYGRLKRWLGRDERMRLEVALVQFETDGREPHREPVDIPDLESFRRFADDCRISLLLEAGPGDVSLLCRECGREYDAMEVDVGPWGYYGGDLCAGGGEGVYCPAGHLLYHCQNWIS